MVRFDLVLEGILGVAKRNAAAPTKLRNNGRESPVKQMLNLPNNGYKIYEVQLYNEQVREMAQRRKRHCFLDRLWATPQVRDVVARDEAEAWALIAERFPPEDGFVVERISTSRC